ncbi:hypothetical protein HX878_20625 [Pseudomonas veronii]|uniref:hypothetical protein n=1 Tax=Pseudomonas veronii TaxID=76761 RepID=UPI0015A2AD6A|nr:hypothetical protein [Pseudomonas veronii]NWD57139.1 hypothetical protein [Pseudomonas veronii]
MNNVRRKELAEITTQLQDLVIFAHRRCHHRDNWEKSPAVPQAQPSLGRGRRGTPISASAKTRNRL